MSPEAQSVVLSGSDPRHVTSGGVGRLYPVTRMCQCDLSPRVELEAPPVPIAARASRINIVREVLSHVKIVKDANTLLENSFKEEIHPRLGY